MPTALIVEDDRNTLDALATLVEKEGFDVLKSSSLAGARGHIEKSSPDVVLCDLTLSDGKGTELLEELSHDPLVDVVVITGNATVDLAVESLRLGATDFLTKPVDTSRLKALLEQHRKSRRLKKEVVTLRSELRGLGRFGPLVGTSDAMQRIFDLIEKVAPTSATVLVIGESGTGKELVAQAIHQMSTRSENRIVAVNCGAISPNLIESELFGHEKGSFTGANRQHMGYFEQADEGTLFLDEITEMSAELQVKLLRVLENGVITRVGGKQHINVDVRIVAATNRNPRKAVEESKLREDLYYRLKVFPIEIPPLRERTDDARILANHFLSELNKKSDLNKRLSEEALDAIAAHSWPGNVRELLHAVERAYIVADTTIEPSDLPVESSATPISSVRDGDAVRIPVGSSLADAERVLIEATMKKYDGDKKKTANILGVSLKTLYNRLNQYEEEAEANEA